MNHLSFLDQLVYCQFCPSLKAFPKSFPNSEPLDFVNLLLTSIWTLALSTNHVYLTHGFTCKFWVDQHASLVPMKNAFVVVEFRNQMHPKFHFQHCILSLR